jgi:asparagine synthase (glutamine-hydrolysing)
MPFSLWFRKECREFVHDLLSPDTVKRRGLFRSDYIQMLLKEHDSKTADHGSLIWGLLSVELWHRAFLDSSRHTMCNHRKSPLDFEDDKALPQTASRNSSTPLKA